MGRTDCGRDGVHGGFEIVRLGAYEDEVEGCVDTLGEDGGRIWNVQVAVAGADDVEAAFGEHPCGAGADEEGDVATGGEQTCAEVAAECAGSEDEDSHDFILEREQRQRPIHELRAKGSYKL
jgi:hypothetical protein